MSYSCFDVSLSDQIAHIQLSRPEAYNSMVPEFWRELPEIVRTLDDAGEARAIVLSSTGKHFTAGMDLAVFTSPGSSATDREGELGRRRANLRREILRLQETFSCLDRARMPVLAAVQGGCIGGGVDLATACCLRYATRDAFFVIQEINLGMMADVGTFNRMPKQLPEAVVRELGYTGDRLPAERAERLGFVNGVFETHEQLVAGALLVAKRIASKAPVAVAATKQMISYTRDHSVAESFGYLNALQPAIFDIEEIKRRLAARP